MMDRLTYRKTILLTLFTMLGIQGYSRLVPESYNFAYLTVEDGLAQNMVDHIYRDSRGFMWFATWNGLNRYDGYDFLRYETQSEENAIHSLFVRTLIEDNHGHLWVGTDEGINIIDIHSGHVLPAGRSTWMSHRLFSVSVNALIKDYQGRIWVGFDGGIGLITLDRQGEIEQVELLQDNRDRNVLSLCIDYFGTVWIGYSDGEIKTVTKISERVFQFNPAPGTLKDEAFNEVFTIFPDREEMWIGTARGLVRYNIHREEHTWYVNDPDDKYTLIQNYVKDIAKNKEGHIIIATYKGLSVLNKETDQIIQISSAPEKYNGLNNNFANSLYVSDDGMIWVGTEMGGVNKMTRKDILFEVWQHDPQKPASLPPQPVNSIFIDSHHNLWIGSVEGGLSKKRRDDNTFLNYRHTTNSPHSLAHNTVSYLTEGDDCLWIASWGGGLSYMKLTEEGRFHHQSQFLSHGTFSSVFISGLEYDPVLKGLWVATFTGLDYYDLQTRTVYPILNSGSMDQRITQVSAVHLDRSRRLWVGTQKGLYCIYPDDCDIKQALIRSEFFPITSAGKRQPRNERINCIFESTDGTLWLGTFGNGLYKMDESNPHDPVFINYGTGHGLSDNAILSIEEGKSGHLWLSTNRGLTCFYPDREWASPFYTVDGLPNNQFYWSASCRTPSGKLLFGNLDGVVLFDPAEIRQDSTSLQVQLVSTQLYNDRVNPYLHPDGWRIKEEDKYFSLSFSALYYPTPEKIRYAYQLEGFDPEWIEVDKNRRFVTYTNLSAGKYTFKVRCTNPDGEWSGHVTELKIRIVPPFYKEKWFSAMLIFIVLIGVYYFNEMRIRNLRRQKHQLEKMVDERTEKIESQKNILERQARDLEDTAHQLQQATQDKINFFTNITHEFKTPLTLILGPIEQALKLSVNPSVIEQLTLVRKNSKYLLSLINQLMDFRKADTQTLKVNRTPGNFAGYLAALVSPFRTLTEPRGVKIRTYGRMENPWFRFDHDLMQKIVVNLLSNAVKFTPDGGQISVFAACLSGPDKQEKLYISVNDSGTGVPEDKREQIFDPFYQLDNQSLYPVHGQSGTGIGLYLCRQIMELLDGTITVRNNASGGASFRVLIPLAPEDRDVETLEEYYDPPEVYARTAEVDNREPEEAGKPLLLIVEDNTDMRAFIRSILKDRFTIMEASNGETGLDKTFKYIPDFIVSDITMPVMDGLEFCRKVKNNFATSHIPILLLTAKSSTEVRIEGYKVGVDGYIAKPFDAELLVARITNMLEGRNRLHTVFENSLDVRKLDMQEESPDRQFLDKLMEVIQDNYQDGTFDVAGLIEKMHMSKSLLHKKLQSLVGQPAVQVIRSYRLNKAKERIDRVKAGGQMNVAEIAYETGFNDPKYFTRCFTRQFGVSPTQYAEKKEK